MSNNINNLPKSYFLLHIKSHTSHNSTPTTLTCYVSERKRRRRRGKNVRRNHWKNRILLYLITHTHTIDCRAQTKNGPFFFSTLHLYVLDIDHVMDRWCEFSKQSKEEHRNTRIDEWNIHNALWFKLRSMCIKNEILVCMVCAVCKLLAWNNNNFYFCCCTMYPRQLGILIS